LFTDSGVPRRHEVRRSDDGRSWELEESYGTDGSFVAAGLLDGRAAAVVVPYHYEGGDVLLVSGPGGWTRRALIEGPALRPDGRGGALRAARPGGARHRPGCVRHQQSLLPLLHTVDGSTVSMVSLDELHRRGLTRWDEVVVLADRIVATMVGADGQTATVVSGTPTG
jgi:hypothetical protein